MTVRYAHVPRKFAEELDAFLGYLRSSGAEMGELDVEALEADRAAQAIDLARRAELEAELEALKRRLATAQAERYGRYRSALISVRAANQRRADVLRALADLTRRTREPDRETVFTAYRRAR
jgi:Asp-tRNA(Asn)/Glu-tRNA(Gln) amidotransferase A subunit family amidase